MNLAVVIFESSDHCIRRKPAAAAASGPSGSSSASADPSGRPVQMSAELCARITETHAQAMAIKRQRTGTGEVAQSSRADVYYPPFD